MRKLLAVVAAASLAAAVPAHADQAVHTVLLSGPADGVAVTCDTSTYPAAWYPCDLNIEVTTGCNEVGTSPLLTPCTLTVVGELRATPTPNPVGRCTITSWEDVLVSYDGGIDPAFHAERNEVATVLPEAGAYVLAGEANTGFTFAVVSPYRVGDVNAITGTFATSIHFSDLEYDCRSRSGGDPSSDPTVGLHVGPTGVLVVRSA